MTLRDIAVMSPSYIVTLICGVMVLVIVLLAALGLVFRERRNEVLEQWIALGKCGSAESFLGTLDLAENRPGLLRLTKGSQRTKWLQFQYRWLTGSSQQATWDEVAFDGARGVVELKRKEKVASYPFSKFSAIRMREISQGEGGSLWHMELFAQEGKNVLFATSARGNRQTAFENSAGLARAISAITSLPVQVVMAGNVWTPGWPPKSL
jgi:hypothetical protein